MELDNLEYEKILKDIIKYFYSHISTEKRGQSKIDKIQSGYLNLIETMLRIRPELCSNMLEFGQYIFYCCLFQVEPNKLLDEGLDMN